MKAEIEKILEGFEANVLTENAVEHFYEVKELTRDQATSSITSLIIKWLEGKKATINKDDLDFEDYPLQSGSEKDGRNQLITELIGEVR